MFKNKQFSGELAFCSNMHPCQISYAPFGEEQLTYTNAEAAYQAMKATRRSVRQKFTFLSGYEAKKLGRTINLHKNWEIAKLREMINIITAKFKQNPELLEKLLLVPDEDLVETNYWGDTYYGVCNGIGENYLGRILYQVKKTRASQWITFSEVLETPRLIISD